MSNMSAVSAWGTHLATARLLELNTLLFKSRTCVEAMAARDSQLLEAPSPEQVAEAFQALLVGGRSLQPLAGPAGYLQVFSVLAHGLTTQPDFAPHPTAVRALVHGARDVYREVDGVCNHGEALPSPAVSQLTQFANDLPAFFGPNTTDSLSVGLLARLPSEGGHQLDYRDAFFGFENILFARGYRLQDFLNHFAESTFRSPRDLTDLDLQPLLNQPVTDVLSFRTTNPLATRRIRTIHELVQETEVELLAIKGFGDHALEEVLTFLKSNNLSLGMG